jgi:hypothetical protein
LIAITRKDILNTGIVVGCVEPAKFRYGLLNHVFDLSVIRYIAKDSECFVSFGLQFLGRSMDGLLVPVRQHHGST